ncbi:MAG TPA: hypothetical protein VHP12_02795, partial [Chitinophagaceae bacterium]|nr:hypothetical protein [Chitinophagaceae bacterium]
MRYENKTAFLYKVKHSCILSSSIICGDTRFDRVIDIAQQFKPIALVEIFIGNHPVIVAGSTWTEDD